MVKDILAFARWQLARFKWHDYLWIVSAFMVGSGWDEKGLVFWIGVLALSIVFIGMVIEVQWNRWKAERKELLETIRDSK